MPVRNKYSVRAAYAGTTHVYVDLPAGDVRRAIDRAHDAIKVAYRLIHTQSAKHPAIAAASFQLKHLARPIPVQPADQASELGRLSVGLLDTCCILDRLENSRQDWLQRARFALQFGGANLKKEPNAKTKIVGR